MAEPIKQEIINNIYENGEGLITGPVLQEVLLDMVDDYNDKVQTVDLSDSTGSWDEASDWVTENSGSIPTEEDLAILSGSIEEWVEDKNYATTASVNELSSSLNERIDNIPQADLSGYLTTASYQIDSASFDERINNIPTPDLSEYATTASVNEATQSVKEWVEAKHYLTTASLSGSVTEETVGFMINDATASVKDWVGDQDYATNQSVTDLSSSIAETISEITGSDLSGYLTTASYLVDSASFDERIDNIDIPDVSIYATTESLNNLSESIVNTYATEEFVSSSIADIEIPSIEGLATTESVNQLSESVAQTIADLPQVDLSGYATTASVNELSESLNSVSSSFDQRISEITGSDISGYLTTASYLVDSASFDQRIENIPQVDLSGYATTSSVNTLSQSIADTIDNLDIPDVSGLATTQSVLQVSESVYNIAQDIPDISGLATTSSVNQLSESVAQTIADIDIPDVSGLATTSSVTSLSESIAQDFDNLDIPDVSIYATTSSVNNLSASFDQRINNITGSGADLSGYALTASLVGYSDNQDITDLNISTVPNYYGEITESVNLGFSTLPEDGQMISINVLNSGASASLVNIPNTLDSLTCVVNGVEGSGSCSIPAGEHGDIVVTRKDDVLYFRTSIDVSNISVDLSGYATTSSVNQLSAKIEDYLPLAGGTLTGNLNVSNGANIGIGSGPEGSKCLLVGSLNRASDAYNSVVAGERCEAHAYNGFVAGRENVVGSVAPFSVALGFRSRAAASTTLAAGLRATASAEFSNAIGLGVESTALGQTVVGAYNEADPSSSISSTGSYAFIVGTGKPTNWDADTPGEITRENGLAVKWNGDIDINYSGSTITLQDKLAELEAGGGSVDLSGYATTASVNQLSASFDTRINSISGSDLSIYATTSSVNQLSESLNSASASFDTRISSISESVGDAIWERGSTNTSAIYKGAGNLASGSCALAVGYDNRALGNYTYAQGYRTRATGPASCAQGWCTSASGYAETALGVFNRKISDTQVFSVGCGFSETSRRNAISVIWDSGSVGGQTNTGSAEVYVYGVGNYLGQGTGSALSLGEAYTLHNNHLFGYSSQSINSLYLNCSNIYTNVTATTHSFLFNEAPKDGATVRVVITNNTSDDQTVLIPKSRTDGYTTFTSSFNGKLGSGSLVVPANSSKYIDVTRRDKILYLDSPVSSTELDNTVGNIEAALQALR